MPDGTAGSRSEFQNRRMKWKKESKLLSASQLSAEEEEETGRMKALAGGGGTRRERPAGNGGQRRAPGKALRAGSLGTWSPERDSGAPRSPGRPRPQSACWALGVPGRLSPAGTPVASMLTTASARTGSPARTEDRTHLMFPGSAAICSCPCRVSFRPCRPCTVQW